MSSPSQSRQMEALFRRGPITIVLVFSPSCPHCHTYMPLWKKLEQTKGRQANLVSMRADIYDKTPMSEKKPVQAVPTVLFVDKEGRVSEAREPRNMAVMSNAVRMGVTEDVAATAPAPSPALTAATAARRLSSESEMFNPDSAVATAYRASTAAAEASMPRSQPIQPIIPGTVVSENPLRAVPATPISEVDAGSESVQMGGAYGGVQYGGNPWAAFMMAARQAAPAAALLGAYMALPKRSSGLPAARTRRIRSSAKRR